MAFFGSMAGSVPYIAKDSVTGVLSHQDDRDGGQIGMVISTLIYAAFFLGMVQNYFGIDPISTIKICGISIVVLVVIGFLINRK